MSPLSLLPLMIVAVGGYLIIKLKFFYILHPIRTLKFTFKGSNIKDSVISLMLALAGTLGVGNIVGVAYGLHVGGAGSIFWLCASALFSSAIKYAEVSLSAAYNTGYGIISVIDGGKGSATARIYAILALVLAFSMGSLLQADAVRESTHASGDARAITLTLIFIFTAFICIMGKQRIRGAVAIVIPCATLLYTGMCLFVIFREINGIPRVLSEILSSAFDLSSMRGGVSAFLISSGIKEGFARGLLSNEAGAGTSSFSHTSHTVGEGCHTSDGEYARRAGAFGIIEVIFDTLLLCPLTAFAILLGKDSTTFHGTLPEISDIFERYIGSAAPFMLLLAVTAFAVSTTLCWYYYGKVSLAYLVGDRFSSLFSALFILSFASGLIFKIDILLYINDIILFLLSCITLYTVIKKRASLSAPE